MIFILEKEVLCDHGMVQENSSSYFLSYSAVDTKFLHFFTYAFTLSIEAKRSVLKMI